MRYWLVKTEPSTYSWNDLVRDKRTNWTGVRNFQARNNLRLMKKGDRVFVYHSVDEKAIVGIAIVTKETLPDETAVEGDWSMVEITPLKPLKNPLTLADIKKDPAFKNMILVQNSRLSVQPVTKEEWQQV